ncbi:serpentine type 7TM GPCR chemoreceptor srsx domain-containing protein [Ditylenchus destructor]|uniref:Serpentine type 7TM GPCR chemoreceptor srsx domain-containing protein n=1 Tax=Ditylenchus destructor TaxID=166010 RepID=A0AAD4MWA5_9BILA|nr:serpentine type 7TM GPCR chemoreceptor srsx domain-containing protein [Ditylenchus destructor]
MSASYEDVYGEDDGLCVTEDGFDDYCVGFGLLYNRFHNAGPSIHLIAPALIINFVAIPGIVLNAFVIYTTYKSRFALSASKLTRKCIFQDFKNFGIQIHDQPPVAFTCFLEILHLSNNLVWLSVAISGLNLIRYSTLVMWEIVAMFGVNCSIAALTVTSVDRFLSVFLPVIHRKVNPKIYLSLLIFGCCAFSAFNSSFAVRNAFVYPDYPTCGNINDLTAIGDVNPYFFYNVLYSNVINFTCYGAIWVRIATSKTLSGMHSRVSRSLAVIMIVVFGGYLIDTFNGMVILEHWVDPDTDDLIIWYWRNWSLLPIDIAAASCGPILYFTSTDYRRAFKQQLNRIFNKEAASEPRHATHQCSVLFKSRQVSIK